LLLDARHAARLRVLRTHCAALRHARATCAFCLHCATCSGALPCVPHFFSHRAPHFFALVACCTAPVVLLHLSRTRLRAPAHGAAHILPPFCAHCAHALRGTRLPVRRRGSCHSLMQTRRTPDFLASISPIAARWSTAHCAEHHTPATHDHVFSVSQVVHRCLLHVSLS